MELLQELRSINFRLRAATNTGKIKSLGSPKHAQTPSTSGQCREHSIGLTPIDAFNIML